MRLLFYNLHEKLGTNRAGRSDEGTWSAASTLSLAPRVPRYTATRIDA